MSRTLIAGDFSTVTAGPLLRSIRGLGFLDLEAGPWLAGDAVRRLLMNDDTEGGPAAEVEVFLPESFDDRAHPVRRRLDSVLPDPPYYPRAWANANTLVAHLRRRPDCGAVRGGGDTQTVTLPSGAVRIVARRRYRSLGMLFADLDCTICMAATDGWRWLADRACVRDLANRWLVATDPPLRAERLAKYTALGFSPATTTLRYGSGAITRRDGR